MTSACFIWRHTDHAADYLDEEEVVAAAAALRAIGSESKISLRDGGSVEKISRAKEPMDQRIVPEILKRNLARDFEITIVPTRGLQVSVRQDLIAVTTESEIEELRVNTN